MQIRPLNQHRRNRPEMPRGKVGIWADRALARRALAAYDEAMLADIGLSADARARECRKFFWQA